MDAILYQCNHKFKGKEKCSTPKLEEEQIKELFVKAVNLLITDPKEIIRNYEEVRPLIFDTECFDAEITELQEEMTVTAELIQKCVDENARTAISQDKYKKKYDALVKRFEKAKSVSKKSTTPSVTERHGAYKPTTLCVNSKSVKALLQSSMRSCGTLWLTASWFTVKPTYASPSRMEQNTKHKSIKRTPHYHYGGEEFFNLFDKLEFGSYGVFCCHVFGNYRSTTTVNKNYPLYSAAKRVRSGPLGLISYPCQATTLFSQGITSRFCPYIPRLLYESFIPLGANS